MTQQQALNVLKTGANVFLTGEPGSGKTHTINAYVRYLRAAKVKVAVTASTGIAATHLGGITVHSWSGIGIKKSLSKYDIDRIATTQRLVKRIEQTAVLVIDEVSMLDGYRLDSVDQVCREIKRSSEPFGGLQVILVGDFFQLPPVAEKNGEAAKFAFDSLSWSALKPLVCYLSEQYRQEDAEFLHVLKAVRRNEVFSEHRAHLDKRSVMPAAPDEEDMPRLFSHNVDVDGMNEEKLEQLPGTATVFQMKERGRKNLVQQLKRGCLSPERLALKQQAQVMFTKNSPKQEFVNGTLGQIVGFSKGNRCPIVKARTGRKIVAEPMEWTIEDNGRVLARVAQIPLRLAWAMTVHKSQGMSLDAAVIDLQQAFEPGQGYVALSRVRSLSGLFLVGYNEQALQVHPEVLEQDAIFRRLSAEAAAAFAKLLPEELKTMQRNFVRAVGGRVPGKSGQRVGGNLGQGYSVAALREKYPNAYRPWRDEEDKLLLSEFRQNKNVKAMAELLGRQPGAITSRLRKLGLVAV